jgi:hypothetical protein
MNPTNPYGDGNVPNPQDDIGITLRKILASTLAGGSGGGGEPSGVAEGDLSGTYPAPVVSKIGDGLMTVSGNTLTNGSTLILDAGTGDVLVQDLEANGEVTATIGFFGPGAGITGVNASEIGGITITTGTVAPAATAVNGSLYSRPGGGTLQNLYQRVAGAWVGIA